MLKAAWLYLALASFYLNIKPSLPDLYCIFFSALFQVLKQTMEEHKVKGFQQVIVSPNIKEGIASLIQASGLGGLRHNTVMMGWPYGWRQDPDAANYKVFMG